MPLNVAIIGGGPGGLILYRLLARLKLSPTVYEQESHFQARNQGGCLDIHADSGQRALRAAGLHQTFEQLARYEAQAMRISDKTGHMFVDSVGDRGKPEIGREVLRKMLIDSIPPTGIKWGSKLQRMEASSEGAWNLHFSNGSKAEQVDLVVGADGAWSRVRTALSETLPFYSGATFVEFQLKPKSARNEEVIEFSGIGSLLALGDGKGIMTQKQGDGGVRTYAALRLPECPKPMPDLNLSDGSLAKDQVVDRFFSDWDDRLQDLIRNAEDGVEHRPLYMLPAGWKWESRVGVTLLGDAAHLMTPFSGEGVNMAMLDALELSDEIKKAQANWAGSDRRIIRASLADAVRAYEKAMWERSEVKAIENAVALETVLHPDSPKKLLEVMMKGA